MGIISKHHKMIKLYYSSKSSIGKKTLAYLEASQKELLNIDVTKTNVTGTQWKEFAEQLKISIGDLVDKHNFDFSAYNEPGVDLSETDWIKVLNNNPEVLTNPVVIIGDAYYQITNPSDVEKLLEPNSRGLDEKNSL